MLLLLLSAVEVLVLLRVLWDCVTGRGHLKAPTTNIVPVDILEKGVTLNFSSSTCACTKPLAWVAVEQMHDQILGLLRHAHGQLEHATLYVVEQLVPKFKNVASKAVNLEIIKILTWIRKNKAVVPRSFHIGLLREDTSLHSCRDPLS